MCARRARRGEDSKSVDYISLAILVAAVLHVLEEYAWPGGFAVFMRRMIPRFAAAITTPFAVVINSAFLLVCASAAVVGPAAPVLRLSVAALLIANAWTHIAASVRAHRYAPGLVTGMLLYLPLGLYTFQVFLGKGWVTPRQALLAALLGLAFAAVPLLWLGLAFFIRRRRSGASLLMLLWLAAACGGLPMELPRASPTPVAVPPTDAPGEPILVLAGGTLIDGTGAPPVADAVLVIRGKRILTRGLRADATLPPGATVIDVSGATILPGFINTHVHGGYDATALAAWAQGGVTTVRDLATRPSLVDFAFRDATRTQPKLARLVAAGPMVTVRDGYPIAYWGMPALTVTSVEDARSKTGALLDQGADLIKIALESGAIFGQKMSMLSPEEAAAIVEVAHGRGKPVSAHVTVAADLTRALDAGVDDIAHMATDRVSDATIQRMVEANVYWEPTLELWQGVGLRRAAIAGNLRRFVAAGGKVALGTDYLGAPNVRFDLGMPITEIELMVDAGMTPMQIIVAATRNAAHVCGLARELGTLEPGKLADVLVVDGDPLADPHALTQTRLVLRDGVVIMQKDVAAGRSGNTGAVQ